MPRKASGKALSNAELCRRKRERKREAMGYAAYKAKVAADRQARWEAERAAMTPQEVGAAKTLHNQQVSTIYIGYPQHDYHLVYIRHYAPCVRRTSLI